MGRPNGKKFAQWFSGYRVFRCFSLICPQSRLFSMNSLRSIASVPALLLCLASCAAPQKPSPPPPPKLIAKNSPTAFPSLAQLRDYNYRLTKRLPEASMDHALPELNRLTWEPQEEYGVPYPLSYKEIGSMPAHHLFKASMTVEGVLCRVWIHTTRNVDLDPKGKLILTGNGRHKILHLSLIEYSPQFSSRYGKRTDWPP
jgi:hypothetical protein